MGRKMTDMVRSLLGEQRRRFIASLLNAAEASPWWAKLNPGERAAFRDRVLACVGVYHDFCLDVIKVSGEDSVRNEHAIQLLEQVHDSQRRLERSTRVAASTET